MVCVIDCCAAVVGVDSCAVPVAEVPSAFPSPLSVPFSPSCNPSPAHTPYFSSTGYMGIALT